MTWESWDYTDHRRAERILEQVSEEGREEIRYRQEQRAYRESRRKMHTELYEFMRVVRQTPGEVFPRPCNECPRRGSTIYCSGCGCSDILRETVNLIQMNCPLPRCCSICGADPMDDSLIEHHVAWNPEVTIPVCLSCHGRIHRGKGFEGYRPAYNGRKRRLSTSRESSPIKSENRKTVNLVWLP